VRILLRCVLPEEDAAVFVVDELNAELASPRVLQESASLAFGHAREVPDDFLAIAAEASSLGRRHLLPVECAGRGDVHVVAVHGLRHRNDQATAATP
jgi:hypothetical protein